MGSGGDDFTVGTSLDGTALNTIDITGGVGDDVINAALIDALNAVDLTVNAGGRC